MNTYVGPFFILSSAMLAVALWFTWRQRRQGRVNLLAPSTFVTITFALQFGISNYPAVVHGEKLFHELIGAEHLLIKTMAIALASIIGFVICYGLASKAAMQRWGTAHPEKSQLPQRHRLEVVLCLYLLGMAARFVLIQMGAYSYLATEEFTLGGKDLALRMVLERIERLCNFSLVALTLFWCLFPTRPSYRLWLVPVFLSELFFNFMGGTKGLTLINFFYVGLVYWYIKRRIPPWRWAVAGAAVWVLITPWNLSYRDLINAGYVETHNLSSVSGALNNAFKDAFAPELQSTPLERFAENVQVRVPLLQEATLVMNYADRFGYSHGKKYWLLLAAALIPRFLWPEKPRLETGAWVTKEIFGSHEGSTSTAITGIGDFYLDFGLLGPLLGFALWGFLFGWFEGRLERSVQGVLFIASLYLTLVNIGGSDAFGILGGIAKDLMILIPFCLATGFGLPHRNRLDKAADVP